MYSCEFCEISKNIFFTEHLWVTASEELNTFLIYFYQQHTNAQQTYNKMAKHTQTLFFSAEKETITLVLPFLEAVSSQKRTRLRKA